MKQQTKSRVRDRSQGQESACETAQSHV